MRAMISVGGVPSEHADPNNPTPLWREGAVVNAALVDLAKKGFDWTTHLASFERRVLFLRGDLDTAHTLTQQQELAASFPASGMVTMQNVGHQMIWERPDEYLAHTRDYFQSIGFAGGAR
jgi:proline iminopeptidase